jgi:hypothetical protein
MELSFVDEFHEDRYLDVPSEDDLANIISGEIQLEFVSNGQDPVVLCTSNKSFQVLEFDTSNTLFLHDGPCPLSQHFSTFELRSRPPPFLELRLRFQQHALTEEEISGNEIVAPTHTSPCSKGLFVHGKSLKDFFVVCAL